MNAEITLNAAEHKNRKVIAKARLEENNLDEAVRMYAELLREDGLDIDALSMLGNLYLASGDGRSARHLYLRALDQAPQNHVLQCQVELTSGGACDGEPDQDPSSPAAIITLLKNLTGVQKESEEKDLSRAASMLEKIIRSDNPAEQVSHNLNEIDSLLPALVEINIRQAWADGRPELVEALHALKQSVLTQFQPAGEPSAAQSPARTSGEQAAPAVARTSSRVLVFKNGLGALSDRMALMESALRTFGCEVESTAEYRPGKDLRPDIAVISNPHVTPKVLESMAALSAAGVPIIVDLDDNFEQMPISHPNYASAGLGTQARDRVFNTALVLADRVTVNSETVANALNANSYHASLIPDGWSSQNPLWSAPGEQRGTINIGWISTAGQMEDLSLIRRVVIRIAREFSNTQIVVIGDSQAYRMFETVPENRRVFLPLMPGQEYPYELGQVDILLVPLRNDPYHMSLSDKTLVQACARGVPWIASPNLSFMKWQAGGLIANNQEEWYVYLRQMVMNADIRQNFRQAGRIAAKSRETARVGEYWVREINSLLQSKGSPADGEG